MDSHREFLNRYPKQADDSARLALAAEFGLLRDGRVYWDGSPFGIRPGTDISLFHFKSIRFERMRLTNCKAAGAIFEQCSLDECYIEALPGHKVSWDRVVFRSCVFRDTTFGPATLSLRGTSFESSTLHAVIFRYGRLAEACFDHCRLQDCAFRNATLTDATFRSADLRKVSFERAPLIGVDFTGSLFHQMDFYGPLDLTPCRALPANA